MQTCRTLEPETDSGTPAKRKRGSGASNSKSEARDKPSDIQLEEEADTIQSFLLFMGTDPDAYPNLGDLRWSGVTELWEMSCKYQVGMLQALCEQWMIHHKSGLGVDEIIPLYARALALSRTKLSGALKHEVRRASMVKTPLEVIDSLPSRVVHELWLAHRGY